MLAPVDKITRGGNDIMQIVVTTACDRNCSNCTQLLPFRHDYRFMSVDVFTEAVASMAGWPGVVALFGGNPCVHPQFPELCRILAAAFPEHQRGLWTNNVLKHGWIAAETFRNGRLNLNAHGDAIAATEIQKWFPNRLIPGSERKQSWHAGILVNRRDLGINDFDWHQARERCDINQKWSGAIVERAGAPYGYFCEVAASLDGVAGLNNGVRATPGWWKFPMSAYADQVRNCCDKGCGVPLRIKGHLDSEENYDISSSWKETIRFRTGGDAVLKLHGATVEHCAQSTDYMKMAAE